MPLLNCHQIEEFRIIDYLLREDRLVKGRDINESSNPGFILSIPRRIWDKTEEVKRRTLFSKFNLHIFGSGDQQKIMGNVSSWDSDALSQYVSLLETRQAHGMFVKIPLQALYSIDYRSLQTP